MRLSKRTEYGLRAAVQLARVWPQQFVQSRDLAKQEGLPNKFLEAILLALRRGNFLESKVGSGGGYRLSRAPKDILVGDLIRRLEGKLTQREENTKPDGSAGEIAVRLINQRLVDATEKALMQLSLEELVEQVNKTGGLHASMYYI